jgi:hypothetical protein
MLAQLPVSGRLTISLQSLGMEWMAANGRTSAWEFLWGGPVKSNFMVREF